MSRKIGTRPRKDLQKYTIILDHLPAAALNPNNLRRTHWTVRHQETDAAKEEIAWMIKTNGGAGKPIEQARISYEFHLKDRRRRDLDNLLSSCKAYQDGLVVAGVMASDDFEHLEIGFIRASVTGHEETIITVEEI